MGLELFPYPPRKGQEIVYLKVRETVKNNARLVIEAPTGFGKTIAVLSAVLAEGKRVIWLSRTGNAILRPLSELRVIAETFGLEASGVAVRGKKDMCPLTVEADREAFTVLCRKCKRKAKELQGVFSFSEIYEMFKDSSFCPYKTQWKLAEKADVVAMSYNYLFGESFFALAEILTGREVLVVDEAHNIVDAANSSFSEVLTAESLKRAEKEAEKYGKRKLVDVLRKLREYLAPRGRVDPNYVVEEFSIADILPEAWETALRVYEERARAGRALRSSLGRFVRFWKKALPFEDGKYLIVHEDALELYDVRAGEFFKRLWKNFEAVIAISGTLSPVQAFMLTAGLEDAEKLIIRYTAKRAKFYAVRGLTTRGEELTKGMKQRYLEFLAWLLRRYPRKNTAVFTASYRILEDLYPGIESIAAATGRKLFREHREMSGREAEEVLNAFKASKGGVLVAPCGGRFAESADFPGKALEVVALIGIPFEKPDLKIRLKIEYYEKLFGSQARLLAYTAPAIRKAAQAIGRAVRGPEDAAVVFLADERYLRRRYFNLLPYHVKVALKAVTLSSILQKRL